MKETEQASLQDKAIICCDCGEKFTWEKGEQLWYSEKGFPPPKRCLFCRQLLRQKRKALESGREVQHG